MIRNERLQTLREILRYNKIKLSPSSVDKDIARLKEQKHQLTYSQMLLSNQQNHLDGKHIQIK